MKVFQFIISDTFMLIFLHLILLIIVLSAVQGSCRMKGDGASIKRGEKSWRYFYLFYSVLSVIMMQIISFSEIGKGYKIYIAVVDLLTLIYLAFFNGWFRNKIIGFVVKLLTKEEG